MSHHQHLIKAQVARQRNLQAAYWIFLVIVFGLLAFSLSKVRPGGGYIYPPWFRLFRNLFYFQFGYFGAALSALLLYLLPAERVPLLVRASIWVVFHLCFVWQLVWIFIHRMFGIELTAQMAFELFIHPSSVEAVGLTKFQFASLAGSSFGLIAVLVWISLYLSRKAGKKLRRSGCVTFCTLFLLTHVPVRAYFVHHINQNNALVLGYDDCAPVSLRSERLIPGLRSDRMALPSFEASDRSAKYFNSIVNRSMPTIPRPRNILWINVESLRFDAIQEQVMPNLWRYRDRFQVRLDRQHWSSGNSTQFGVFSMLTGLSGYHFNHMRRTRMNGPFLELLTANRYRLRVGKKRYVDYVGLNELFPSSTDSANFSIQPLDKSDIRMVDSYLKDRHKRDLARPHFDFLPFDAPHWPYRYPAEQTIFEPVISETEAISSHVLLKASDLERMRNRYRNSCHFTDDQIGRVLRDLEARGGFQSTIVIVVGDHGEEFQERGQTAHSATLNDYQGRTVLWMHLPDQERHLVDVSVPTMHVDIVPTLLEALGFSEDFLYTQGRSLLSQPEHRQMLSLCEQGFAVPLYRALVTDTYITRWWRGRGRYLFAGVQRRDGQPVTGKDWASEAQNLYPKSAEMYEILPDITKAPRKFSSTGDVAQNPD